MPQSVEVRCPTLEGWGNVDPCSPPRVPRVDMYRSWLGSAVRGMCYLGAIRRQPPPAAEEPRREPGNYYADFNEAQIACYEGSTRSCDVVRPSDWTPSAPGWVSTGGRAAAAPICARSGAPPSPALRLSPATNSAGRYGSEKPDHAGARVVPVMAAADAVGKPPLLPDDGGDKIGRLDRQRSRHGGD